MKHTSLRLAAAVAVAGVALLGAGLPAAHATSPSVIDPSATVTLNVHKYLGPASTTAGDGTTTTIGGGYRALSGVDFDAYRVFYDSGLTSPVDLTTNAGWATASAITGYVPTQTEIAAGSFTISSVTYYLDYEDTQATSTTGLASFTPLSGVGFYLANEDLGTSGTVQSCQQNGSGCVNVAKSQLSASSPFFVTLPTTDPDALNSWMYTVDVYPKNQSDQVTKTVTDSGTQTSEGPGAGGEHDVAFTITSGITDGMSAAAMGTYVITDQLDSRLGTPTVSVYIDGNHDGDGADGADVALALTTDYTLSTTGGKVVVTMTAAGRGKMVTANTADTAATVVTTITAEVTEEGTDGLIDNQAYVIPNQAWLDANPGKDGIPTNADPNNEDGVPTVSYYGDLNITKENSDGDPLENAEFAVYQDLPTSLGGDGTTCSSDDIGGTVIGTGTTDANGLVTIQGLQTSDWYDGGAITDPADYVGYCLVETKAPSGYNLKAEAIAFTILYGTATVSAPAFEDVTVTDQAANLGNVLPFTGGQGVEGLSIAGALLVFGGLLYYLLVSRRRNRVS